MAKSFDRYILKEISSPFSLGLLIYTSTLLINMIFLLSDTLIAKDAGALTVLQILLYMLPDFLSFTIPMATLMGVMAGLSRMSTDSEIIAFRTMGVSNFRILKPIIIFAAVNWLFSTWLIMYMAPEASYRLTQLWGQLGIKREISSIKPGEFYTEIPELTLYFNDLDTKTDEWKDVFIYNRKEPENDTVIYARRGKFIQLMDEEDSYLFLRDALIHKFPKKEPEKFQIYNFASLREKIPNLTQMKHERREKQLIFPELVRRMKKEPANSLLSIEFHRKFALPFACLALAFLAISLGISTKKGGKVSGFIISLGIIFVYYSTSITTENMVRKGFLSPFWGMWSADLLLLATGLLLFHYTSREKTIRWERLLAFTQYFKNLRRRRCMRPKKEHRVIFVLKIKRRKTRFRLLKIIDSYVSRRLAFAFLLIFASLLLIFYIINFVEMIDDAVENKASIFYIFQYLFYDTPEILSFVIPVATLTAVLLTFSIMSKNNEIIAVQVSGISLYRLTLPAIFIGFLLSGVFFFLQEKILPDSNKKKQEVRNIIYKQKQKTEEELNRNWVFGKNNAIYFYDAVDSENRNVVNFNVIYLDNEFSPSRRVSAKFGRWIGKQRIMLEKAFSREFREKLPVGFSKLKTLELEIPGGQEVFTQKVASAQYMNIESLKKYIRYLQEKKSDTQKFEAKLYYKYAFPFSSFVMVLIAIPFSFIMGNRGTLFGIGLAVGISMSFWFVFAVCSALGSASILTPFISAFAPLIIFTTLSVYLFLNLKT